MKLGNAEAKPTAAGPVMIATIRCTSGSDSNRTAQLIRCEPLVRNRPETLHRLRVAAAPPIHSPHPNGCSPMSLGLNTLRCFASQPSLLIGERMSPNV